MEVSITKMSQNGQVVIPSEIRKEARLKPQTKFIVLNDGEDILLKKVTEKILEDFRVLKDIEEGEEQIRRGEYVEADTSMTEEEIDKLLMSD